MIHFAPLSWMLTVVFAATAAYYAVRCLRSAEGIRPTPTERVSSVVHVAMSLGMLPMLWWWGTAVPAPPQLALFGVGALWFLGLAASGTQVTGCALHQPRGVRLYHLHHFVLMAAMVWMVALMSVPSLTTVAASAASATSPDADHAMDAAGSMDHAMVMDGSGMATMAHSMGSPPAATALSLVLALYFLLVMPWWLVAMVGAGRTTVGGLRWWTGLGAALIGSDRRAAAMDAAIHAAKCGGMGVMLLAMR